MKAPEKLRMRLIAAGVLLLIAGIGFLTLAGKQLFFEGSLFAPRYSPERREARLGLLFFVFGVGGAGLGVLTIAGVRRRFIVDQDGEWRDALAPAKSD